MANLIVGTASVAVGSVAEPASTKTDSGDLCGIKVAIELQVESFSRQSKRHVAL